MPENIDISDAHRDIAAQQAKDYGYETPEAINALAHIIHFQTQHWAQSHTELDQNLKDGRFDLAVEEIADSQWYTNVDTRHEVEICQAALIEAHISLEALQVRSAAPAQPGAPEAQAQPDRPAPVQNQDQAQAQPQPQDGLTKKHNEAALIECAPPIIDGYDHAAPGVEQALLRASENTGLAYSFLVRLAHKESSLGVRMGAPTSSAYGLTQITNSTMIEYAYKYGPQIGHPELREHVERYNTADAGADPVYEYRYAEGREADAQAALMEARGNHEISAGLSAAHIARLAPRIETLLGRPANQTDLYAVHFLGYSGARRFLARHNDPSCIDDPAISCENVVVDKDRGSAIIEGYRSGESFVRQADAEANGNIFFEEDGTPRTLRQVYDKLAETMTTETPFAPKAHTPEANPAPHNAPAAL